MSGLAVRFWIRLTLKLRIMLGRKYYLDGETCSLADTDVPYFAFANELLQFLPSRIWVVSEVPVDFIVLLVLLKGDGPFKDVLIDEYGLGLVKGERTSE